MSWSLCYIGNPENISSKLDQYEMKQTGASLAEFQEAKPHLQGLLSLYVNFHSLIRLAANGHATFIDGKKINGYIVVNFEQVYGEICI